MPSVATPCYKLIAIRCAQFKFQTSAVDNSQYCLRDNLSPDRAWSEVNQFDPRADSGGIRFQNRSDG